MSAASRLRDDEADPRPLDGPGLLPGALERLEELALLFSGDADARCR
jgi:hypothetical protein